jgi:hypothetical protein
VVSGKGKIYLPGRFTFSGLLIPLTTHPSPITKSGKTCLATCRNLPLPSSPRRQQWSFSLSLRVASCCFYWCFMVFFGFGIAVAIHEITVIFSGKITCVCRRRASTTPTRFNRVDLKGTSKIAIFSLEEGGVARVIMQQCFMRIVRSRRRYCGKSAFLGLPIKS